MSEPVTQRWLSAARRVAGQTLKRAATAALSSHVRLGVTGLSGAGKTVFTTAIAHALIHARNQPEELAFLDVASRGRIVGVAVESLPDLAPFPIDPNIDQLATASPSWPAATQGLSGLRIVLRFAPAGALRHVAEQAQLRIDIVDYPGEWLVDLPLLDQDFRAWSKATWEALDAADTLGARTLAQSWCKAHDAVPAPVAIDDRARAYARLLRGLKGDRFGWAWLTPGRILTASEDDWLASGCAFFPLPPDALGPGHTFAELEKRYGHYIESRVKPFYRNHLRNLDRQIVLVDLLGALARGPESFHGMRRALGAILAHFRYGGWRILAPLLGRRIGRVMVAATKADLVTASQLPALRSLLRETVDWSVMEKLRDYQDAVEKRTHYRIGCLASIVSAEERMGTYGEAQFPVLYGKIMGEADDEEVVPSPVPPSLPKPAQWPAKGYKYYPFEPPDLSAFKERAFPHNGLDKAMQFLIGDKVS